MLHLLVSGVVDDGVASLLISNHRNLIATTTNAARQLVAE